MTNINSYERIRTPKNYRITEYGLEPMPDIPEKILEIYSNYFMVRQTTYSEQTLQYFEGGELTQHTKEIRDFENFNDFNSLWSEASINIILNNQKEKSERSINDFIDEIERFARGNKTGLKLVERKKQENLYKISDDFNASIYQNNKIKLENQFQCEEYSNLVFSISRSANEHILDTTDMCFTEMSKYKELLENFGLDWSLAEDSFYSLSYDNLIFRHIFDEIPRDFWETPEESWKRLGVSELEEVADTLLSLLPKWNNDQRQNEIKEKLDYVSRLIRKKSE